MNAINTNPPEGWQAVQVTDNDLKIKFAQLLFKWPLTPNAAFVAATELFPRQDQTGIAATVALEWPRDPVVQKELHRLGYSGSEEALPTRADVARRYINIADDESKPLKERLTALDKYAELMNMKPKADAPAGVTINDRRVFVLPAATQSLEAWEKFATEQQAKLIDGAVRRE